MYTSLDKIDIVAEADGRPMAVQLDHRSVAEIEATPELSVLFAVARVVNARQTCAANDVEIDGVVYAPLHPPPPFLRDALATAGAFLQDVATLAITPLASAGDPAELVDHTFRALSAVVRDRHDTEDAETAIDALEEEVSGSFGHEPDEEDELAYWTAVLELMALTGEVIRARVGGSWVLADHGSVPFGFKLPSGAVLVPGNRAQRSLEEGAGEGMRALLFALDDLAMPLATASGPVLPSLRSKAEALESGYVFRPLFEKMPPDAEPPVICYGHDSPRMFALIRTETGEDIDHDAAIAGLRGQDVAIEEGEVAGMRFLSIGNSYFATEKLLDPDFMRALSSRLGDDLLGCAIPRRNVMLVTALGANPLNTSLLASIAVADLERSRAAPICRHVILVQNGAPVGMARAGSVPTPGDEPPRKRGFLSRLFGRGSST